MFSAMIKQGRLRVDDRKIAPTPEEIRLRVLKRKIRTWGGLAFALVALGLIPVGLDPTMALLAFGVGVGIGDFTELANKLKGS